MIEQKKLIPDKKPEKKLEAVETKKPEVKKEEIKVEKKEEKKVNKKKEAVARGTDLSASKKHCMAICDFIRGRKIPDVIKDLEQVAKLRKAIPMRGEIPHRKDIGPGRYPVNASKVMIKLLKGLEANARALDIQDPVIKTAMANKAARPYRRFGYRRFKRTNVLLTAKEMNK